MAAQTKRGRVPLVALAGLLLCLAGCAAGTEPFIAAPTPAPTPTLAPTPLPELRVGGLTVSRDAETLDLSGRETALGELTAALLQLPRLNSVNLTGCPLSDADKAALMAAFPAVDFLWTVTLFDDVTPGSHDEALDISFRPVESLDALTAKLALLPRLRDVDMCGCGLSNADMERLTAAFPQIRFVWLVRVANYELRTDARAFSMGQRKDVEGVRMVAPMLYHEITNEDIEPLKYCTELIALDMGHAKNVSDISCLAGLTKLQYLVIAIMSVEDIRPLQNMTELVYLECFNNDIADISPLSGLTSLRYLNCGMNPFTDSTPLLGLTQLERLWINRAAITREQRRELEDTLNSAQVMCAFGADPSAYGWRKGNQGYIDMQELFGLRVLGQ